MGILLSLEIRICLQGTNLPSVSVPNFFRLWDARYMTDSFLTLPAKMGAIRSVHFSPDGKYIVSGSWDNTIRVWEAEPGVVISESSKEYTNGVSLVFSPDGEHIVSGSWDHTIHVWNAEIEGVVSRPFKGHTSYVSSVMFSPDGKHIVSGSWDHTICVWDVKTGEVVSGPFKGHTNSVTSVAFSPDGKHIVSGSWDDTIRVWDVDTREVVSEPFESYANAANSVALLHNGKHIISGSNDNTIHVWNASDITTQLLHSHSSETKAIHHTQIETHKMNNHCTVPMLSYFADSSKLVDGWILGPNSELLFWVPPSLRVGLWWPRNTAVIAKVSTKLDFTLFCHGKSWTQCKR